METYQNYPLVRLTAQNILDNIRFYQIHPFVKFTDKKDIQHEGHIGCVNGKDILIRKIGPVELAQSDSETSWSVDIPVYFSDQVEVFRFPRSLKIRTEEETPEYRQWKSKLSSDPKILGGETTFPNSRLSVIRIGGALEQGESIEVIQQDYPYLTESDCYFAQIYVKSLVAQPSLE